ncbi:MAG: PKD domain-containing protein, partial [Bacteroidetes bacterium]
MRISNLPFVGLLLLLCGALRAQSGCPGCLIELPPLPADTIFLSQAPDGQAGQPYDGDLSFRMPQTTTPVAAVDSTVPAGLTLDKVTILSVVNLPPGLSWEPSQFEFNPSEQTDGCVKLCGTPLQPGLYEVSVIVSAEISLISQTANFDFDIYIAPAASQTDGFSMTNTTGCGSTTVAFQNLLPSNDQPGISYWWDFGNGQTSSLENPDTVRYDSPGIFPVHYTATFDTVGHLLTAVTILDVGCGDVAVPPIFNGNPDLFIEIENPAGDRIFKSDVTDNAGLPLGYTFLLPLDTGTYTLHVKDDEFLIGDEHCGTVTFSRSLHDTLTDGDLQVLVQVVHPVFTVEATDTVRVFPQPDPPLISPDSLPPLCDGQPVQLFASYTDGLQWYRDSSVLFGDTSDLLTVTLPGSYWVEYTSPDGCKSQSQPVRVEFIPLPSPPIFTNDDNFVSLND